MRFRRFYPTVVLMVAGALALGAASPSAPEDPATAHGPAGGVRGGAPEAAGFSGAVGAPQDPAAGVRPGHRGGHGPLGSHSPPVEPAAGTAQPPRSSPRAVPAARIFKGYGFDTCTAPPLATMSAWRKHSRYRAVGVYFGGRARGCAQPRLTPGWVRSVHAMGWRLLPLYMGSQARCVIAPHKRKYKMSARYPARNGSLEAKDAVRRARALGLAPGSPLFLDMENYDQRDRTCLDQVLAFVQAWNKAVRASGYRTGFYSSASSGVSHMARAQRAGRKNLPQVIWFGRWSGIPTLGDRALGARQWHPHRRVHQYNGDVRERHGGRTMLIDRNYLDAPVAIVRTGARARTG